MLGRMRTPPPDTENGTAETQYSSPMNGQDSVVSWTMAIETEDDISNAELSVDGHISDQMHDDVPIAIDVDAKTYMGDRPKGQALTQEPAVPSPHRGHEGAWATEPRTGGH